MKRGTNSGFIVSLFIVVIAILAISIISYGASNKLLFSAKAIDGVINIPAACVDPYVSGPKAGECILCTGIVYNGACYKNCTGGQNPRFISGVCQYCNGSWSGDTCITNNTNQSNNISYSWCDRWMMNWSSNISNQNNSIYNLSAWCNNCNGWINTNLSNQTINRSSYTWNNLCVINNPSNNQTNQSNSWCQDWLNNWTISRNVNNSNWTYNQPSWCSSCRNFSGGNWSNYTGNNTYYNWQRLCSVNSCSNGVIINGNCVCINGIWYLGQCYCPNGQVINNICYRSPENETNGTSNNSTYNGGSTGSSSGGPGQSPKVIEPGANCKIKETYWSEGYSTTSEGESVTLTIVGEKGCTEGNKILVNISDVDFLTDDSIYSTEVRFDKNDADTVYTQISLILSEESMPNLPQAYDSIFEGNNLELKATTIVEPVKKTSSPLNQMTKQKIVVEVNSEILEFILSNQNSQE